MVAVDAFAWPAPDDPVPGVDVRERVAVRDLVGLAERVAVDVFDTDGDIERERVEDADGGSGQDT